VKIQRVVQILLRGVTIMAVAYMVVTILFSIMPAHMFLPADKVVSISAHNCGSRFLYLQAVDNGAKILPVVMAKGWSRGKENEESQRSCDLIAQTVRDEQPAFEAVPKRFICQNIRRYVRERYLAANFTAGPPLLYLPNENIVVGAARYDEVMASIGLVETANGLIPISE
jgi:hypothetical protein